MRSSVSCCCLFGLSFLFLFWREWVIEVLSESCRKQEQQLQGGSDNVLDRGTSKLKSPRASVCL